MAEQEILQSQDETKQPALRSIRDSMSFKISLSAIYSERVGGANFLRKFGITLTEWRIIALAGEADWISHGQIRSNLFVDKAQFSRCVKGLMQKGLLISRLSEHDARKQELSLSDEGRALREKGLIFVGELNDVVFSALREDEIQLLGDMLDRVIARQEILSAREFSS